MLSKSFFLKANTLTLGSVLVLILVGSIVRSTGSGMGCPDWPKCFGSYIPPTSAADLPDNYLDIFKAQRISKNERLAKTLRSLGFSNLSNQILNDPAIQDEQEFNVTKAWIEYINRLIGVLIGLFVFLNMIASFHFKERRSLIVVGILIFVLTGFQGWVGSLVVSTNLLKGLITFHMILALAIVALLIWMNVGARALPKLGGRNHFVTALILFILLVPQIVLGTEVRDTIDRLMISTLSRADWFGELTQTFFIHRSYSWLILIGSGLLLYRVKKEQITELYPWSLALLIMIVTIAVIGVIMSNFGFPFWTQPLHLILATGIFSVLFYLLLRLNFNG